MSALELVGTYRHSGDDSDPSLVEYVVPVRWIRTRERSKGIKKTGMFANQNSACKLRNTATLDILTREFDLESTD